MENYTDEQRVIGELKKLEKLKEEELAVALVENEKFKWSVFLKALVFIIVIYGTVLLTRYYGGLEENVMNELFRVFTGAFAFSFLFTIGFSQALLYVLIYPYLFKEKTDKLFTVSIVVTCVISFLFSQMLYHLWVKTSEYSYIIDAIILFALFLHVLRGLKIKRNYRTIRDLTLYHNKKILLFIEQQLKQLEQLKQLKEQQLEQLKQLKEQQLKQLTKKNLL